MIPLLTCISILFLPTAGMAFVLEKTRNVLHALLFLVGFAGVHWISEDISIPAENSFLVEASYAEYLSMMLGIAASGVAAVLLFFRLIFRGFMPSRGSAA